MTSHLTILKISPAMTFSQVVTLLLQLAGVFFTLKTATKWQNKLMQSNYYPLIGIKKGLKLLIETT